MITVAPGTRTGSVTPPASKSAAHRLLILAALGNKPVTLRLSGLSDDIEATVRCLRALGAGILLKEDRLLVTPIRRASGNAAAPMRGAAESARVLPCGESGSTLRFLLPLAAALGIPAVFQMEGRLSRRPILPLVEALQKNGAVIRTAGERMYLSGKLRPGNYVLPGDVSSQFVTGLLLSLPLLPQESRITILGRLESEDYIRLTESAMQLAGIRWQRTGDYRIPGNQCPALLSDVFVERDWSAAANFLVMGAFSKSGITLKGLDPESAQGDKKILEILKSFGADVSFGTESEPESGAALPTVTVRRNSLAGRVLDTAMIPDLVPVLSVLGAFSEDETRITNAARLRLKESDRLKTSAEMLGSLGAEVTELPDGLVIRGKEKLCGGTVPACRDHRIAMAAAVAASLSEAPVTIPEADCVAKSYPAFFEDLESLETER